MGDHGEVIWDQEAPEQEVNHSIFSTVSGGTVGIFLKMYVGIRHWESLSVWQLSPDLVLGSTSIAIYQLVKIDELPEKFRPIDQLRQLINWAEHFGKTLEFHRDDSGLS